MKRSLGLTVRFLHRGNRDLSLSVTRYLCLAATHHADLLVPHIQPIVDSIINGEHHDIHISKSHRTSLLFIDPIQWRNQVLVICFGEDSSSNINDGPVKVDIDP